MCKVSKKFAFALLVLILAAACAKKKGKADDAETIKTSAAESGSSENAISTIEPIPAREDNVPAQATPSYNTEIIVNGVLFTSYYNRATTSPYFQASTELKDLFPDIADPKTSQLCLPTIMSYELYTQLAGKPSILTTQSEAHLMRPVTEQVREMYRVCETDRYRGTTAPQAANCAVKVAYSAGLKSEVHVIGLDAKWKGGGYYIDSVTTEDRPVSNKDIVEAVANRYSAMFLIGFYNTTDGINFDRAGGHFISITATGISAAQPDSLSVWIVDPATPGSEKASQANPFNGSIQPIKNSGTNLEPTVVGELVGTKIQSAGYRIFIESAIRYSLTRE